MVLVLDESVSVLVDQVGVETVGRKMSFGGDLEFEGVLPAVAWLKARSTSVTRDTHGTWDWLVDFLHQPLGGRADLTGGVIEVLFGDKIVVNPQLLLKQTFVPKNRPS